MVGAAFGVAEVNTPFRYYFRYPVLGTVRLETRWPRRVSVACLRIHSPHFGRGVGLGATPLRSYGLQPRSPDLCQDLVAGFGVAPSPRLRRDSSLREGSSGTLAPPAPPAPEEFLEDPAHAPHHPPHRGPRRALPHAPLRRVPRACRRSDPRLQRVRASPVRRHRRILRPSSGAHRHRDAGSRLAVSHTTTASYWDDRTVTAAGAYHFRAHGAVGSATASRTLRSSERNGSHSRTPARPAAIGRITPPRRGHRNPGRTGAAGRRSGLAG